MIKDSMKKLFLLSMCLLGLYGTLFPQAPAQSPIASPTASTATPAPSATSSSASSDLADRIHRKLEKNLGRKHGIIIEGDDKDNDADMEQMRNLVAIPIVAIVFLSIF